MKHHRHPLSATSISCNSPAALRCACSPWILATLGLLVSAAPIGAAAQGAGGKLAPGTLPVLRSGDRAVVGGTLALTRTDPTKPELTITQTGPQVIANWKSFNISSDAKVTIVQPSTSAALLNRIFDASPTVIQGQLIATGQVLLINQNGILFDRGSQVNVGSLIASTLNIKDDDFKKGNLAAGGTSTPIFAGGYDADGNPRSARPDGSRPGNIGIGSFGALSDPAPLIASNVAGGSIMIFAPRIDNNGGVITSPDGQVILAAGAKAYLAFSGASSDATTLRGFQVEVEAAGGSNLNLTNLIRNAGTISSERGNVSLAALAINQEGRISASTAIAANGSIFLKARTLNGAQSGTVTLAPGSQTQALPDTHDYDVDAKTGAITLRTITEGTDYASSTFDRRAEIRVDGHTIANNGTLQATGGKITLTASSDKNDQDPAGARVYFGSGSVTSVAGNWVDLPYESNLLTIKPVTSNELADSPDQKTGILKGATVTVDLRKGSPLLKLDKYIAAQLRTIAEKTTAGGTLSVSSTGSLIQRRGATLDASGGGFRYAGGTAAVSQLMGSDGKIYSITNAPEQLTYTRLLDTETRTDAHFNETRVYSGLNFGIGQAEPGYVEGKAGGSILLNSAAGLVLDGTLLGGSTIGPNQLAKAPRGAALTIGTFDQSSATPDFAAGVRIGNVHLVQKAGDTLGAGFAVDTSLTTAQTDNLMLAADQLYGPSLGNGSTLAQTGFDRVTLNSNGRIFLAADATLNGPVGSYLQLRAPQIDLAGSIDLPSGSIYLLPQGTSQPLSDEFALGRNSVTLRSSARLSTAGLWINNATNDGSFVGAPAPSVLPTLAADGTVKLNDDGSVAMKPTINGGSVTISAGDGTSSTLLARGSHIDVGGGAALGSGRKLTSGTGGTIDIANGVSSAASSDWLQAELSAFSPGKGGSLKINTPRVVIDADSANGILPSNTTRLTTSLFTDHGFADFTVTAAQGLAVQPDVTLTLQQKNLVIDTLAAVNLATGADRLTVSEVVGLLADQRLPVSLKLSAPTPADSSLAGRSTVSLAKGSAIVAADPGAGIVLSAVDGLRVDGRIAAPGGQVSLLLAGPALGAPDLTLGSSGSVSVAGSFVRKPADDGTVKGAVYDAGSITIAATKAGIDLQAGSVLDLNGITQTVQSFAPDGSGRILNQALDGNAGTLVIRSQGLTRLDGTLQAARGSARGAGGSFALELSPPLPNGIDPLAQTRIDVAQTTAALPDAAPGVWAGIAADPLGAAGFQKLRLQSENTIGLNGDLTLNFARGIRLDAPLLDVIADGHVGLRSAASIELGQSLDPRSQIPAELGAVQQKADSPVLATRPGNGSLTAQAGTIDLFGSITVNGIADARLASAGDIRLTGRTVNGIADTDTSQGRSVGSLTTEANVRLEAAQVYPTTRTDYTLSVVQQPAGMNVAGGYVQIASNGNTPGAVYSADGKLTIAAANIVQGGTLKAPLGRINLQADSLLELSPGSVTSVSAGGLTIPFGTTLAAQNWTYQDNIAGGTANPLTTASADTKRVQLGARAVNVLSGAVVDLSGGGDLQAAEFVPGSGGSVDTFTQPDTFAIIPKARLSAMPVDTDIAVRYATDRNGKALGIGLQSASRDKNVYDSLHIAAGGAVPEGDYVLLPGRYALLPDAYLVQLKTGSAYANLQPGQTSALLNGQAVLAGYRLASGTGIRESRTVGVVVRPGSAATTESDYNLTDSSYFTRLAASQRLDAARIPLDAGRLAISGAQTLQLAGRFDTSPGSVNTAQRVATGRSAEIDIAAARIAVVDRVGTSGFDADVLQLDGAQLSSLQGSLLLGGQRGDVAGGVLPITTTATDIVVANSAAGMLQAGEVLLTASGSIDVRAGSVVSGIGPSASNAKTLKLDGAGGSGGALLRVASGAQIAVDRGAAPSNATGDLVVAKGATLQADGSLLMDATHSTRSQATLVVANGGAASLASAQVSLGETEGVVGIDAGLVLNNSDLASLAGLGSLTIKGYQGLDLYGNAVLGGAGLGDLTLDGPALRGHGKAADLASVAAGAVRLAFSGSQAAAAAGTVDKAGRLSLTTQRLVIDRGDKTISGFQAVDMMASGETVGQGAGSLTVAGDWTLTTPKVGAAAGSAQTWRAADLTDAARPVYSSLDLRTSAGAAGTSTDNDAGGRLALEGRSISVTTSLQARSGSLSLAALGSDVSDGVTLAAGARLDAGGLSKSYNGHVVTANAGSVTLSAASGLVSVQAGSSIGLGADAAGGNGGTLAVQAARSFDLAGSVQARGAGAGLGGQVSLDLGTLDDFPKLAGALGRAGFDESFSLRLRQGDLAWADGNTLKAHHITVAADQGRIDLAGKLDASSLRGSGSVSLWAANGLSLAASSLIDGRGLSTDASSAAGLSNGAVVQLATTGGTLDFADKAVIDVSQGAKGSTGRVVFDVSRDDANQIAPVHLNGTVRGRQLVVDPNTGQPADPNVVQFADAEVVLQATRRYDISAGTLDPSTYAADHRAFIDANADPSPLLTRLKNGLLAPDGSQSASNNASLRGATEVRTSGDITLASAWDLTGSDTWLAGGKAGTLTLRAQGDLTLKAALGNPNDDILPGKTWSIQLVAGADLTAADPLATLTTRATNGTGNVLLQGNAAKIRTGTGSIEIAAANDFSMTGAQSVIYTAGQIGATDTARLGNNRWGINGGGISIRAGHDASGAADEWITEWLRRPLFSTSGKPEWWAYRPNFQQGLGTLAGGDIRIEAGHNVNNLAAMAPTTGRSIVDAAGRPTVDVQGGGNLDISAANDLAGGSYLVGRGDGRVRAGGSIGTTQATQLFVMGASSGDVPEHAAIALDAGQSITLQSVNNPTAIRQETATFGSGPGFAGSVVSTQRVLTYFTYAQDSTLRAESKSGDVTLGTQMVSGRSIVTKTINRKPGPGTGNPINDRSSYAAYPSSLEAIALNGDVSFNSADTVGRLIYTYASPSAQVGILAAGSVNHPSLWVSDRTTASLRNVANFSYQNPGLSGALSGELPDTVLLPSEGARMATLLARDDTGSLLPDTRTPPAVSGGYALDIQALTGDVSGTATSSLFLPEQSRVRAGQGIFGVPMQLQNLDAGDLTQVRADNGDFRVANARIDGPGRVLIQAGGSVDVGQSTNSFGVEPSKKDLGGLVAAGSSANPSLKTSDAARMTLLAGVKGDVDLKRLDTTYADLKFLNDKATGVPDNILAFYRALNSDRDLGAVAGAADVKALVARDDAYKPYVDLVTKYPRILSIYQTALKAGTLPLGSGGNATQAAALYGLLNLETDGQAIARAKSVSDLIKSLPDGSAYQSYVALDKQYPLVFADYRQRRIKGGKPQGLTPILFSQLCDAFVADAIPGSQVASGDILTFQSSIQSYGSTAPGGQGSIDLWAPGGGVLAGLTTPPGSTTIGVVTNGGGAIQSVVKDDFSINQGKVLTVLGGDILIYSRAGNIDAGRGAKTSQTTSAPEISIVDGVKIVTVPPSASGSGIQTLTSDPDGPGPLTAPKGGDVNLFAPAGTVDAGEAGIRSSGNLGLNAQTVLNAGNIQVTGSSAGVPKVEAGSVASTVASSGSNTGGASKSAEEAAAGGASRAPAATTPIAKPTILSVEVLGFGDKNCKEDDKDCFGK